MNHPHPLSHFLSVLVLAGAPSLAMAASPISVHEQEWRAHQGVAPFELPEGAVLTPPAARPAAATAERRVMGYFPYWEDPSRIPYEHLTHLSWFSIDVTSTGTISNSHGWNNSTNAAVVQTAHSLGIEVLVTAVLFDDTAICTLVNSATNRSTFINTMKSQIQAGGADGISVDFETPTSSCMTGFETLIAELAAAFHPLGLHVDIAMPAVDWSGAFDYDYLAATADTLFIMGYNYHWNGGSPGPVDPLYGGGAWGPYSLDWTVKDYLSKAGSRRDKIVLGLPLYGIKWPTTSEAVPGTSSASGASILYKTANAEDDTYGKDFDTTTQTPYYTWTSNGQSYQVWYQTSSSVDLRMDYAASQGLGGVGFWALNYDGGDSTLWAYVDEYSGGGATTPVGDLVGFVRENDIYTGAPIVGATVTLDTGVSAVTDSTGYYVFEDLEAGITYTVTAEAPCYETATDTRYVEAGIANWKSMALVPLDPCPSTGGCPSSVAPLSSTTGSQTLDAGSLLAVGLALSGLVRRRR